MERNCLHYATVLSKTYAKVTLIFGSCKYHPYNADCLLFTFARLNNLLYFRKANIKGVC